MVTIVIDSRATVTSVTSVSTVNTVLLYLLFTVLQSSMFESVISLHRHFDYYCKNLAQK